MRTPSAAAALLCSAALLGGCGSDSIVGPDDPEPSVPPVTAAFAGAYTLSIRPDPLCSLPAGPHAIAVVATTAGTSARPELRVTLPGGDTRLAMEMISPEPGRLRGSIGTVAPLLFQSGFEVHVRTVGEAVVSRASDGRGEIVDGMMFGDVEVNVTPASVAACSSLAHRFSLRAR